MRTGKHNQRFTSLLLGVVVLGAATLNATAIQVASAATVTLPDLKINVPVNQFSIGTNSDTGHRQLQFTHQTWDAGTGPFAIRPTQNTRTGVSTFVQEIYRSPSPGNWVVDHSRPVGVIGVFQPPSDYNFPLTRFTLNKVSAGVVGAVVAVSPKVDYCITGDVYIGGVANTPNSSSPPASNCTDPNALLGLSVGWGDQYDQTDNGQPIDLTGVPDGTYVLHATVDPQHVIQESNTANNVTNTTITIAGSNVTVLGQSAPSTIPPSIRLTSPTGSTSLSGTVTLQASASAVSPAHVATVRYLLDGAVLSPAQSAAPYTFHWGTYLLSGTHTLSAQVTDSNGTSNTSATTTVKIVKGKTSGVAVDVNIARTGHSTVTSGKFSTAVAAETIVAFVGADGPTPGYQQVTLSGLGLKWHLVRRSNAQAGDAEIWSALAPGLIRNGIVSSVERYTNYAQQLQVLAFSGSSGIGANSIGAGATGAAKVQITTSATGSVSFGVGADWDNAIGRTVNVGQSMVHQWVDQGDGDTFWVQSNLTKSTKISQVIVLGDSAPTTDRWDMAAVELKPIAHAHLVTAITNPAAHEVLAGSAHIAVVASDTMSLKSVRVFSQGRAVGAINPLDLGAGLQWNTTKMTNGPRILTVVWTDQSGAETIARVPVVIANPAPAMTCFVLASNVSASGGKRVTVATVHVAGAGERLMAFVRSTSGSSRHAKLFSRGLTWTLLRRANTPSGDLELWTAVTTRLQLALHVSSVLRSGTQDVTVIGIEGTKGIGTLLSKSGNGAVASAIRTSHSNSLLFAFGVQRTGALHKLAGWTPLNVTVHSSAKTMSWVSYSNQPVTHAGTEVVTSRISASSGPWATVTIELPGDDG